MAHVQPFRGIRYNPQRIGDLSTVICPPFDVISAEEQDLYYRSSPYNMIRLESGEERPEDGPEDNRYTRAASALRDWLDTGLLFCEERPAFYLVEHRFPYQDTLKSRYGLLARVRLEELDSGRIRPHEMTMREPAQDRLSLLRCCRANFSPIMGLFRDEEGWFRSLSSALTKKEADLSATDSYGVDYLAWVVTDEETIASIHQFFTDKVIYIADGHHRYETALAYRKEQLPHHPHYTGDEAFNFVMMSLAYCEDPSLIMVPTHRLVRGLEGERIANLKGELALHFNLEGPLPPQPTLFETLAGWLEALEKRGQEGMAFGLYGLHGQNLCLVSAPRNLGESAPLDPPEPWRDLDVGLLHWAILRGMLGIDTPEKEEYCLDYTRDGLEALSRVDSGESQLAFLLNAAPLSKVLKVADAGARVPQKSTYFYPKTPAGLVINPLWD